MFGTGRFSNGIMFGDGTTQTTAGGGGGSTTGTASGVAFFGDDNNLTESDYFIFDSGNGRLGVGPGVSASDFISTNIARITRNKVSGGANAFNSTLTVENGDSHGINIISSTNRAGNIHFSDTSASRGMMGYQHSTDFMYFYTSATERVRIDSAGNVSIGDTGNNGQLYIVNDTASDIGLTVQGAASQSANLQEWQDSSATELASINQNGLLSIGGITHANTANITVNGGSRQGMQIHNVSSLATVAQAKFTDSSFSPGYQLGKGYARIGSNAGVDMVIFDDTDGTFFANNVYVTGDVGVTGDISVTGALTATTKSFLIDHPTKEGMKLQYGSLEGPENGVYVRGTTDLSTIELPDYWSGLVDENSITATLTPVGKFQGLYIIDKNNQYITVGGVEGSYDYVVYGERKDVDKLEVEW